MTIEIIDPDPRTDVSLFKRLIETVFDHEKIPVSFINVVFLATDELRKMKRQYFGLDVYTDVIAFNLNDPETAIEGEIYLSLEQINLNAAEYKTSQPEELHRVLIHGCLHLCGYEDDSPSLKAKMNKIEDHYLAMFNLLGV